MKITSITDYTTLNNGIQIPWLGFGVFKIPDGREVEQAVKWAIEAGYRSIDTAAIYGNERGVGNAIRKSGVPRNEIFLTTKVWNEDMRKKRTTDAFKESLERLETDYVDLYLIHWPVKGCYQDAWKALEDIYASGQTRAIGVSNFLVHHLEDLLAHSTIVPAVNQVEFHPYLVQPDLMKFCQKQHIQLESWSPLMRGKILTMAEITQLAEKYHKTPAQIVLRWDLQHGVVTIPKSVHKDRIIENARVFDFELSAADMMLLDQLDRGERTGADPDNFDF